jgi:hypothetical protein
VEPDDDVPELVVAPELELDPLEVLLVLVEATLEVLEVEPPAPVFPPPPHPIQDTPTNTMITRRNPSMRYSFTLSAHAVVVMERG